MFSFQVLVYFHVAICYWSQFDSIVIGEHALHDFSFLKFVEDFHGLLSSLSLLIFCLVVLLIIERGAVEGSNYNYSFVFLFSVSAVLASYILQLCCLVHLGWSHLGGLTILSFYNVFFLPLVIFCGGGNVLVNLVERELTSSQCVCKEKD